MVMEPTEIAWFRVAVFCERWGVKVYVVNSKWWTGESITDGMAPFSAVGRWIVSIIADMVERFALSQFMNVRRIEEK